MTQPARHRISQVRPEWKLEVGDDTTPPRVSIAMTVDRVDAWAHGEIARYGLERSNACARALGFSVGEIALAHDDSDREHFTVRVAVTDRSHHRRLLHALTGLETQEHQARTLSNEITELRATMSQERNRSASLGAAAFRWLEERYRPLAARLREVDPNMSAAELYCDILEYKWLVSEREQRDVGHEAALAGYLAMRATA